VARELGSVEIVETAPLRRGRYTVITGFAGAGFIGNTALMYIVRSKGFRQRAYLKSDLIPPMMLLIEGRPIHSFRVYSDDQERLLFLITESLISSESVWEVAQRLMQWLKDKGAREFVAIEGMPFGAPSADRRVYGFTLDERNLAEFGVQAISEGAVSGINAVMLEESLGSKISWMSLLVPTNLVSNIDYGGSFVAVETLNRMFKLGVDATPLKQRDEMLRKAIESQRGGGFLGGLFRKRG